MPEKDTPLSIALHENLRLRLMLSSLPPPVTDVDWKPRYVEWWFRNKAQFSSLPPDDAA